MFFWLVFQLDLINVDKVVISRSCLGTETEMEDLGPFYHRQEISKK